MKWLKTFPLRIVKLVDIQNITLYIHITKTRLKAYEDKIEDLEAKLAGNLRVSVERGDVIRTHRFKLPVMDIKHEGYLNDVKREVEYALRNSIPVNIKHRLEEGDTLLVSELFIDVPHKRVQVDYRVDRIK